MKHHIHFLKIHVKNVTKEVLAVSCEVLSIIFDTDDYQTNEDKYMDETIERKFSELGDLFIYQMSSESSDLRRKIRPLLDELGNHK